MPSPAPLRTLGFALGLLLLLGGCASVYRVDNQVQSFAQWDVAAPLPVPPQRYRFERLPSQSEAPDASAQDALEDQTAQALARMGWHLAPALDATDWTVHVRSETLRLPRAPWEDPWDRFGLGVGVFGAHGHWGSGMLLRHEWPYFERRVVLVIRQNTGGRVVYETWSRHDGRWNSSPALWRAMLDAALRDFPQPPAGLRQIDIDLPR